MSTKSKKPQKPPSQQHLVEEPVQGTSKGKQPIQPPKEQPPRDTSKGKQPIQPPAEQPARDPFKGRQPIQPPKEQSAQASSKVKKPQQIPLVQSKQAKPEVTQPHPEQQAEPDTKGKQRQESRTEQPVESKSKGKQPMSKPVYGNPWFYIARIPVKRDARMKRVLVSIGPDTAFRHPQTFFFKNIPSLEPYWGRTNYKAFTATRIVRLEREGKPMPYFLMVCRGEYPKIKSPQNENAIFTCMYEPIFGDAFVFKLGDPELYEDGYARYVHIEEDIRNIDWLPMAIRIAARKVENAVAANANPGFPDINNYADRKTMADDAERMFDWMAAIKKANRKYSKAFPIDLKSGLPDVQRMQGLVKRSMAQVAAWKRQGVLPRDEETDPSDWKKVERFVQRGLAAEKALLAMSTHDKATKNRDETLSTSTDMGRPGTIDIDAFQNAKTCFLAARAVVGEVEDIAHRNLTKQALNTVSIKVSTEEADLKKIRKMIDYTMINHASLKQENAKSPFLDPKILDEIEEKARAAYQAMEKDENELDTVIAFVEFDNACQRLEAEAGLAEREAQEKAEADATSGADTASTSGANPEMPDLSGQPGPSRRGGERLNRVEG